MLQRCIHCVCLLVLTLPATLVSAAMSDEGNAIRVILESQYTDIPPAVAGERLQSVEALQRFYESRGYQPAWFKQGQLRPEAEALFRIIENSYSEALVREDYHYQPLKPLFAPDQEHSMSVPEVGDVDLLLSDAFILFGTHRFQGKLNPETVDPEWVAMPGTINMVAKLEQALAGQGVNQVLDGLLPKQSGFFAMKEKLAEYQQMRENGGWPRVSAGPTLRIGDREPRVQELRERLVVDYPELASSDDTELFDEALEQAVQRFQQRHGLESDGIVGPNTLAAMNVPIEFRLAQIEINMERWRWLPESLGERYVLVNIANFDLKVMQGDELIQRHKVVVGRDYRRTPVFSDEISYLVLNPTWTVPWSIATKDKLPQIKKDPAYLTRKNFKVYEGWGADQKELDPLTINWDEVSRRNFGYRLVQGPGEDNALGQVKFMFPNKHAIYLHDTPSKELFNETRRAFSSGCIRVHEPLRLAELLLSAQDDSWTRERIDTVVNSGQLQTVRLKKKVPVHLLYWTAWVDTDGSLAFREDIYDRDQKVFNSMHFDAPQI